ncbi:MAG: hypothetical protein GY936_04770 [Ignavibacteriae bacterium]|nr:hypothetical protein [Ignavibacteriota bacterium]
MKKKESSFLKKLLFAILTILPLLFVSLFIIKEVKGLNSFKNELLQELREKENKLEQKRVAYQKLTSEDEIVKRAKDKFELIRIDHLDDININSNQIKNLEKMISKKYD